MLWGVMLLALSLSVVHFFSDVFSKIFEKFHVHIRKFSAGFFISLIFLELFPKAFEGIKFLNIFFAIFIGFVAFHLAEKYVYQHVKEKHKMIKDLKILHETGFFIEHFAIGFFLVLVFRIEGLYPMLVFIPLMLHTISSSLSMEAIHLKSKTPLNKVILSLSTLIGASLAYFVVPFGFWYYGLFSLLLGALFYTGVRDMLPLMEEKTGPLYFLMGAVLNILLFAVAGMF